MNVLKFFAKYININDSAWNVNLGSQRKATDENNKEAPMSLFTRYSHPVKL
jgi:hypothetical protein